MLAYNESAHAFFKWDPAKGEYSAARTKAPATNMAGSS
jgi:hypothetical protein